MTTLDDLARVAGELPLLHNGRPALLEQLQAHASVIAAYVKAQRERDAVGRNDLLNIANAKRFDRTVFADDTEFADWAQSRARFALAMDAALPTPPKEPTP